MGTYLPDQMSIPPDMGPQKKVDSPLPPMDQNQFRIQILEIQKSKGVWYALINGFQLLEVVYTTWDNWT